jgi:hypothetical protein
MKPNDEVPQQTPLHAYAEYGWLRGFNIIPSMDQRLKQEFHTDLRKP